MKLHLSRGTTAVILNAVYLLAALLVHSAVLTFGMSVPLAILVLAFAGAGILLFSHTTEVLFDWVFETFGPWYYQEIEPLKLEAAHN